VTNLVRLGPAGDESLDALERRLDAREALLRKRRFEMTQVRIGLEAFRIRYRQEVGRLHDELDELQEAIAAEELGEMAQRLEEEGGDRSSADSDMPFDSAPRLTSDAVRRLFREVAKMVHPDRASDEDRERRHRLMIEANRAYALGDEERLRSILAAWEQSPEAIRGDDPEATRRRLLRRIAQIDDQLNACDGELASLQDTPLWRLKVMVDEAAGRGKDLVADMVRRLNRDIMAARNRLDAMRWRP
jgi:hypothetical protein